MEITRKTIDAFWARVNQGVRMTCLGNTYWDSKGNIAVGRTGVITKPGKTSMRITQDDGTHSWINPPTNVRDVIELTEDTITYRIWPNEVFTATWRITAEPATGPG